MRNLFKSISAIALLAATLSFADSMCYELCMSCRTATRASNCDQIESTCNCPFVVDSAKSKNMGVEMGKRKLVSDIFAGCDKAICARTVTFEDGYYKTIEKGSTTLTRFELISKSGDAEQRALSMQPSAIKAANATVDSLMRRRSLLPIAPMSMECTNRCDDCAGKLKPDTAKKAEPAMTPADSATKAAADSATKAAAQPDTTKQDSAKVAHLDTAKADTAKTDSAQVDSLQAPVDTLALAKAREDSIAKADSLRNVFCRVTETTCQCKAHEENTLALIALDKEIVVKRAIADSLLKLKPTLLREDMARAIADSVQARCNTQGKCRYTITYTSKELALLEMHIVEDKPAMAPAPAFVEVPATAEPAPKPEQQATAEPQQPAEEACPQAVAPADTAKDDEKEKKKDRIFYKVMEFTYGNFNENGYYAKDYGYIENLEEETGYEAALNYYLRWYFYDGGAFSIGLGTSYHYKKFNYEIAPEEKYSIYYHNIGVDVPISFRLGVPYIPIFKPFISQTFNFHKPIFEVYKIETPKVEEENEGGEMDAKELASNFINIGILDDVKTRFNGAKDLTFSVWLGFGLQITRHFSAEYQINFGVGTSGNAHRYQEDGYWRVLVNFAW